MGVATSRRASLTLIADHDARATVGDHDYHLSVVIRDLQCEVFALGAHYSFERLDPLAHVGEVMSVAGGVRALMPGRVVALLVKPGASVSKGEPLLVLEAMKMEQTFSAPADGVCVAFNVTVGEQVVEGSELVEFRAANTGS